MSGDDDRYYAPPVGETGGERANEDEAERMYHEHTEVRPCIVGGQEEMGYTAWLRVGVQQFCITNYAGTLEEAEWYRRMLAKALASIARTPSAPPHVTAGETGGERGQWIAEAQAYMDKTRLDGAVGSATQLRLHLGQVLIARRTPSAPVAPSGNVILPYGERAVVEYWDAPDDVKCPDCGSTLRSQSGSRIRLHTANCPNQYGKRVAPAGRQPCDIRQQDTSAELDARVSDGSDVLIWLHEFRESFAGNVWHEHVYDAAIAEIQDLRSLAAPAGRQDAEPLDETELRRLLDELGNREVQVYACHDLKRQGLRTEADWNQRAAARDNAAEEIVSLFRLRAGRQDTAAGERDADADWLAWLAVNCGMVTDKERHRMCAIAARVAALAAPAPQPEPEQ